MRHQQHERGFVLMSLLAIMVPIVLLVGSFATTMFGRNAELNSEIDNEIALLAAEAGVDDAIHRSKIGTLVSGMAYQRNLGSGQSFTVIPTFLGTDGHNNDADLLVDEADEDVFQIEVIGRYRHTTRRVAAYLGTIPLLPPLDAAFATMDDGIEIDLNGTPVISGIDVEMDGTAGSGPDVPGIAIAPPGTLAHLTSELSGEEAYVVGPGGPPSIGLANAVDLPTLVAQLQNIANVVLTNSQYSSFSFGDGPAGVANVTYRNGNVRFAGNTTGAGILVVTGDLELRGNFRFDGVIIVLGEIDNSAGTADVFGSVLQGPSGGRLQLRGTSEFHYSSQAINLANSLAGQSVAFNGWQELSR